MTPTSVISPTRLPQDGTRPWPVRAVSVSLSLSPSVLLRPVSTSTRPCLAPSLPASPPPFPHSLLHTASTLSPHRVALYYIERPSVGARFWIGASTP
ncbi:hypothetical protein CGRA01v4_13685 [Colletotrichum graminicola]|nr:hypothetical protein CGRA01v4_13685 [Colletotrichum graminicola]